MDEAGEGEGSPAEDLEEAFLEEEEAGSGQESDSSQEGVVAASPSLLSLVAASPSLPSLSPAPCPTIRRTSCSGPGSRKSRPVPAPVPHYSSSSEEQEAAVTIRRRKKRKRPVGEQERKTRQKAAWIEEALRLGDRDRLAQLAASHGGLLSDEVTVSCPPACSSLCPAEASGVAGTAGGRPGQGGGAARGGGDCHSLAVLARWAGVQGGSWTSKLASRSWLYARHAFGSCRHYFPFQWFLT